jgi:hypothetical protein
VDGNSATLRYLCRRRPVSDAACFMIVVAEALYSSIFYHDHETGRIPGS